MISGSPIAHVPAGLACLHPLPNVTLPANFTLTCINFHIHLSVERIHAYLVLSSEFHVEIVMPFGITFGHLSCPVSLGWKSADDLG
jgi:hypothetical protein